MGIPAGGVLAVPATGAVHPYAHDIEHLVYDASVHFAMPVQTDIRSLADTPYQYIDTREDLCALATYLDSVSEMAIDLEVSLAAHARPG